MLEPNRGLLSRLLISNDGRLRPALRVLLYLLILGVVVVLTLGLGGALLTGLGLAQPRTLSGAGGLFLIALYLLSVLAATWIARRFLDRRSLVSLGFGRYRGWLGDVAFGLALGLFLMTLVFLIELGAGWLTFEGFRWQQVSMAAVVGLLASSIASGLVVAVNEETISRGYVLQNLEEAWGTLAAVGVSSAFFALLHALNPSVGPLPLFNLAVAGVFLAAAYLITRSLWLPIALHFSWNFFQGTLYGFPVSGGTQDGIIVASFGGPAVVTGGAFGPEGGLLGLAVMLLGIGMIYLWGRLRHSRSGDRRM